MPNWKKVAVSGSSPIFNNITASGNISASGVVSASSFSGDGSGLTGVPFSGAQTKFNVFQTGSGTDSVKPINGSNIVSGNCSTILGGYSNIIEESPTSTILNGRSNSILGNDVEYCHNTILNGKFNQISESKYTTILGGQYNTASATDYSLINGDNNKIHNGGGGGKSYVSILSSQNNEITGNGLTGIHKPLYANILGSNSNIITGSRQINIIGGGRNSAISTADLNSKVCQATFIAGNCNQAGSDVTESYVRHEGAVFVGGSQNCAYNGGNLIGGRYNELYVGHRFSSIIEGQSNKICNNGPTHTTEMCFNTIINSNSSIIDSHYKGLILGGSSNLLKEGQGGITLGSTSSTITGSNAGPIIIGGSQVCIDHPTGNGSIIAIGVNSRTITEGPTTGITKVFMDSVDVCNLTIQTSISAPKGIFGTGTTTIDDNISSTGDFELTGSIYAKTDITASGNISASGNLFADLADSSTTTLKTVVYDTTSGKFFRTGSYAGGGGGGTFPFTGDAVITGSLLISSSQAYNQSLKVLGSGSTVFDVIGSAGNLLTVDDDLSGTLFIANDQNGIPSLEVSASGEVYLGRAPQSLYTTVQKGPWTTSETLISYPTASHNSIFIEYTAYSENNAQIGNHEGMVVPTVPGSQTPTAGGTSFNNTGGRAWLNFKYILTNGILKVDMTANATAYPNVYIKAIIKAI
jgi:hypothetical protein